MIFNIPYHNYHYNHFFICFTKSFFSRSSSSSQLAYPRRLGRALNSLSAMTNGGLVDTAM